MYKYTVVFYQFSLKASCVSYCAGNASGSVACVTVLTASLYKLGSLVIAVYVVAIQLYVHIIGSGLCISIISSVHLLFALPCKMQWERKVLYKE